MNPVKNPYSFFRRFSTSPFLFTILLVTLWGQYESIGGIHTALQYNQSLFPAYFWFGISAVASCLIAYALGMIRNIGWCTTGDTLFVGDTFTVVKTIEGTDDIGPFSAVMAQFDDKRKLRLVIFRVGTFEEEKRYRMDKDGNPVCLSPQVRWN